MTELYTVKEHTYTGQATFAINFPLGILSRTHVTVQVNDAVDGNDEPQNYTDIEWVSDAEIIINGLSQNDTVKIRRTVPKTQLLTAFSSGADITRENMDDQAKQAIMVYHEVLDGRLQDVDLTDQIAQVQALVDTLGGTYDGELPLNTQADINSATINPLFLKVNVGGITYARRDENPAHMYSTQDAEGNYWEIDNPYYISNMALDPASVPSPYNTPSRVFASSTTVFGREDTVSVLADIARKQDKPFTTVEDFDTRVRFDPISEAFSLPDDDAQIYDELPSALRTAASLIQYRPARENHNALEKAFRWGNGTFSLKKGNLIMFYEPSDFGNSAGDTPSYAPIPLFGKHRIGDGVGQKLFVESRVVSNTIINVSLAKLDNDPRNEPGDNAIYRATVTYGSAWGDHVVVGKAVANRGVSGATRAEDGVSCINGAYEILTISEDRRTLTFDVWNPRELTAGAEALSLPSNPALGNITPGGVPANTAIVADFQMCPVGGWNGKGFEGYLSFERGAMFRFRGVGFCDWTDNSNNELLDSANPTGFTGDRKLLYLGHDVHGILEANCTFAGGEGAAIRAYGGNTLYSVHTIMGGLARNHLTEVGYRIQQNTTGQLIRTTSAGYTLRALELGNSCTFSVHSCGFYACNYGVYAIVNSCVSTNSATIMYCNRNLYSQGMVEMTVGTRLYSSQWAMSWDSGEFRGSPYLEGNVFDTLGNVGPGEYYRGGWWRNVPSLNPPSETGETNYGGRVTGRALALTQAGHLYLDDTVTDRYRFRFGTAASPSSRVAQDFNVVITPRDEAVKSWKFDYQSLWGFDVYLYDAAGASIDADFTFNVIDTRAQS